MNMRKIQLGTATSAAKRIAKNQGITDPARISGMAAHLRKEMIHGGMQSRVERYGSGLEKSPEDLKALESRLTPIATRPVYSGGTPVWAKTSSASAPKSEKSKKQKGGKAKPATVLSSIPSHAVKLTRQNVADISEQKECDCGKCKDCRKGILNKIKKRYIKETVVITEPEDKLHKKIEMKNINEYDMTQFVGKKVLVETVDGTFYGIFGTFKGQYAIYENSEIKRAINLDTVLKFVCEGVKLSVNFNRGTDSPLLQEKIVHRGDKVLVTNEAGTKVLGTHESEASAKKQLNAIHASQARHGKMHESSEILLKENIRERFFMREEVVHKDHEFTMTDDDIYKRDKIADKILSDPKRRAKLKLQKGDTEEEAAHRIATSIVVCDKRGGGGGDKGLFHGDDTKDSRRKRRSGRELTKRDKTAEARREKETVHFSNVKTRKERKFKRNKIKGGQKGVFKDKFRAAAESLRKRKKAVPAYMYRRTANLRGAEGTTRSKFGKMRAANELARSQYKRTD